MKRMFWLFLAVVFFSSLNCYAHTEKGVTANPRGHHTFTFE